MAELAAAQAQSLEQLARLDERYDKMCLRQDSMWGELLELRYVRRAAGLFGRILRKGRVFTPGQNLPEAFEEALAAALSPEEYAEVRLLDALMFGRLVAPYQPVGADVVLAIEVSGTIGGEDVTRPIKLHPPFGGSIPINRRGKMIITASFCLRSGSSRMHLPFRRSAKGRDKGRKMKKPPSSVLRLLSCPLVQLRGKGRARKDKGFAAGNLSHRVHWPEKVSCYTKETSSAGAIRCIPTILSSGAYL
jgi:hypothetical protein